MAVNLSSITPLILTWNEAPNLARCLQALAEFPRVVLLDSFSTDETLSIARSFPNVVIFQRGFDDHTTQWNHGVEQTETPWVLALDGDYQLSTGFADELHALNPPEETAAYYARFRYCVAGHPLRAALYPPRAVLFRKDACTYRQDGHTQLLEINGGTATLEHFIHHDDRKPLSRWVQSQEKYARLEADKLTAHTGGLRPQDRLRKTMVLAPIATLVYCLFVKGLILDGWRGWFYTLQRVMAELILALHLVERHLSLTRIRKQHQDAR